ncbi:MAG: prepilin-type N-terminal cleavage/methylation domain-containing protein, partial [Spartobacteria bacterium]|nr:prepilin-type N-terminal cleavage/methylation domain-containing protein [Spartobacteria bacterium]
MKRTKKAFTLVELLVVITIIGILLGIIYPAFNAVKNRGYQTKCSSNLKQL